MQSKIFINSELIGYTENPIKFSKELREKRRSGKISHQMNITYYEETNEIYIFTDPGRARRPLIIVKDGVPLLKEGHINRIAHSLLSWDDLIRNGLIEFLDAEEEENSYIAVSLADLNEEHTHLEIDPATMLGICAGIIPFSDHNSSPRNTMEAGMTKQALGLYVSNYALRTDTRAHLLHHPQTPIVKTRIIDTTNYDLRPSGQNFVVALMSYEGYNMEDGMVFSKSSLERGLARSSFFRSYDTSEKMYAGGLSDNFEVPDKNVKGFRSDEVYRNLDEDGFINPESYVESGDVLIGKTSPPRFLEFDRFGNFMDIRRETSVTVRHGEKGIVDAVLISETVEGSRLAKIRVRDTRQPEYGDKFASRHGHKGVIGLIVNPEDLPFTEFGIVPDLIVNPHAFPARMSIGHIFEMVAGKAGCLEGKRVDATPFNQTIENEIKQQLLDSGFESAGCESLYDGRTGERFDAEIFVGVAYYQKLHHMTTDKIYARSRGPVQVISRQPTEGRAREGGLRFGEMERDCLIAHGAALTLKERLLDESDKYTAIVCENCGMLAVYDRNKNKKYCPICGDVETYPVEISYAFKLLLDELKSLCIFPQLVLGDKTEFKKSIKRKSSFKPKPLEDNRIFISKTRLVDEEPLELESETETQDDEKIENCIICGRKLTKNQKQLCKSCARKQYTSRIIKKLSTVVKPNVPFKKGDLQSLNLVDLQIKDYIWTLQEYDLIDIDNNKFTLKDEKTLNKFRTESGFDPIDFDSIGGLDKKCKTCGRTLPISKFYKTSNGYEDNCKDCKKLITTANYLNDIINNLGFDKEFSDNDLKYVSNPNQRIGIIWALQESDLLIDKGMNSYILSDKSSCLEFLNKYFDKSKSQKTSEKQKSEVKDKPVEETKSKVKKTKSKSEVKDKPVEETKSKVKKKKSLTKKQEQMSTIIEARKNGKSREEAAQIAGIPLYKIIHWYNEGEQGFGKENVEFYKQLKEIEDKLYDSIDTNERKQMEFVLRLLRKGKSKEEISKLTEISVSTISSWYSQGKDKGNKNTVYFYNEMNKIKEKEANANINHKSNIKSETNSLNEKNEMDVVLNALRRGKSRIDAVAEANISITKLSSWEMNGRLGYNEDTIYFINELEKIQSKNEVQSENNLKSNTKKNDLKNSNLSNVIKSAVDAINSVDNKQADLDNYADTKDKSKDFIKINTDEKKDIKTNDLNKNKSKKVNKTHVVKNKTDKSDKKSLNKDKIDLNDEKQVMDAVLSLMRNGYSRVQAAQELGIKIGQIVIWYTQGRNNKSPNTVYFFNQLNRIEKN